MVQAKPYNPAFGFSRKRLALAANMPTHLKGDPAAGMRRDEHLRRLQENIQQQ
jgi:hypothetical protein